MSKSVTSRSRRRAMSKIRAIRAATRQAKGITGGQGDSQGKIVHK